MVLLISSSALAPFRPPPSTLDESLKEPSRLSDRIVVCDSSSSKAFVPIFHFQTSSFWKVTDLFLCIDEREEVEERGFFPIASLLLAIFCIRLFDNLPKCLIKERAMLEVPPLYFGQNVNKLTKPHVRHCKLQCIPYWMTKELFTLLQKILAESTESCGCQRFTFLWAKGILLGFWQLWAKTLLLFEFLTQMELNWFSKW